MAIRSRTSATLPAKLRGSEKLLKGRTLTEAELVKLVSVTKIKGVKVVDWTNAGQPRPDVVTGTLQVGAAQAGRVVGALLQIKSRRPRVEVFPLGIPVVNVYNVRFRV